MSRPQSEDEGTAVQRPSAAPRTASAKRHTIRRETLRPVAGPGPNSQGARVTDPDTWREIFRDAMVSVDTTPIGPPERGRTDDDAGYQGWIYVHDFGPVSISDVASDPMRAVRTPRLIDRSPADVCHLTIDRRSSSISQGDRPPADLGAGDAVLVDSSRPWVVVVNDFGHHLVVNVPRADLRRGMGVEDAMFGRRIPGDNPTLRVLTAMITEMGRNQSPTSSDTRLELGHTACELVASVVRSENEGRLRLADPRLSRHTQLLRMRDFVQRHLADTELSPRVVADAFDVSLRYVELVFREGGSSPAQFIRETRLNEARRMLADPRQRHRPIAAIGRAVGIERPSAFSRAFRGRFDVAPRDYREAYGSRTGTARG